MNPDPAPVLSVIIPVWNGERYLAEAISSVLEQEGTPVLEVIVVDDGSDDRSAAVAEWFAPPVRCVRTAHAGLAAARNAGVQVARGEYLLHLDSDDLLPPASIATRMAAVQGPAAGEAADIAVGMMVSFVSPELDPETASRYRVPPGSQRGSLCASVVRADFAAGVGQFDSSFAHGPDLDWMLRAKHCGARIVEIPDVVHRRRIHGANMSLTNPALGPDRLATIRAALNRRQPGEEPQDQ